MGIIINEKFKTGFELGGKPRGAWEKRGLGQKAERRPSGKWGNEEEAGKEKNGGSEKYGRRPTENFELHV